MDNFSSDSNEDRNRTNENDLEDKNKIKGDANNIENESMLFMKYFIN